MRGGNELEDALADLKQRLRRLEDLEEIRQLKAVYAELADDRYTRGGPRPRAELEGLARRIADLFTDDAVWDGGPGLGECRGREAIARRFAEPTLRFAWHYFVKPRIRVDGDRAEATWDVLAPCTTRDGRACWMAGVEYDEYARHDGRWLHSRMRLRTLFFAPHDRGWAPRRD